MQIVQPHQIKEVIKFHYAPMAGHILRYRDGVADKITSWSDHHEILNEFLKLGQQKKLQLEESINYGHELFHGHSGKVEIYTVIESE
jgi:predicted LPLAT superfamily acyltransferase